VRRVDAEFQRAMIRVITTGGIIGAVGAVVLVFAIRAFRSGSGKQQAIPFTATVLVLVVLGFVMICCFLLLRVSLEH
jgi:high-affinity Fe2+/Pb2+ permease